MGLCISVTANAESVTDRNELLYAIERAADGDTIYFYGIISEISNLGSGKKHITLKRGTPESCLITTKGVSGIIQNITFDGSGVKAAQPILKVQGDYIIENCIFQNCGELNNASSSGCIGGAIQANFGSPIFGKCQFINNNAVAGGHIAIIGDAAVSFYDCIMKAGYAGSGGAISIAVKASCMAENCTITENRTLDYGGGIANGGKLHIRQTKLFNNQTVNGGADIATKIGGTTVLEDSIETLQSLFEEEKIIVHGWVCDYNFEENIFIPDVELTKENLLKLDYEFNQPTEPENPDQPSEPDKTEPDNPENPDQPTEPSTPDKPSQPDTPTEQEKPEGSNPSGSDTDQTPDKPNTPATPSDANEDKGGNTTTNTSSNSSTDNSNRSTSTTNNTDNRTTDNSDHSRYSNTTDSNNTSTVNYYTQQETQPSNYQQEVQTIIVPVGNAESGEPLQQTIRIESPEEKSSGNYDGMTLNVNVNLGTESTEQEVVSSANKSGVSWYQMAVLCLLSSILVCLLKRK